MTTATIQYKGITMEVEYTFHKSCRGARDSLGGVPGAGPPLEPDEPAGVEIETVCALNDAGNRIDLTELLTSRQYEDIETLVMEAIEE